MICLRAARSSRLTLIACVLSLFATGASAEDLTSASFIMRGAHTESSGAALASSGPRYSGGGASVGQADGIGWSGASASLDTSAPGFWPIVAGGFPSLDLDGDLLQAFFDLDDDNDGLLDVVETRTGTFVSPLDVGTDPTKADTDGDGFDDGAEVLAGTDPNLASSFPDVPAVPALPWLLQLALLGLLLVTARGARVQRQKETT